MRRLIAGFLALVAVVVLAAFGSMPAGEDCPPTDEFDAGFYLKWEVSGTGMYEYIPGESHPHMCSDGLIIQ